MITSILSPNRKRTSCDDPHTNEKSEHGISVNSSRAQNQLQQYAIKNEIGYMKDIFLRGPLRLLLLFCL